MSPTPFATDSPRRTSSPTGTQAMSVVALDGRRSNCATAKRDSFRTEAGSELANNETRQMMTVDRIRLIACERQPYKREVRGPGVELKVAVPELAVRIELRLMA